MYKSYALRFLTKQVLQSVSCPTQRTVLRSAVRRKEIKTLRTFSSSVYSGSDNNSNDTLEGKLNEANISVNEQDRYKKSHEDDARESIRNTSRNTFFQQEMNSSSKIQPYDGMDEQLAHLSNSNSNVPSRAIPSEIESVEDELLFRHEPELRDDALEEAFKDEFGEEFPVGFVSDRNVVENESAEPMLPSEKNQITISSLHKQLKLATSPSEVLDVYSNNKGKLYIEHYDTVLRTLTDLVLIRKYSPSSFVDDPQFLNLSKKLCKLCRRFDSYELVTLIKFLVVANVSPSSQLFGTALMMMRHQINDLPVRQLLFTNMILSKIENTKLVEALRVAVPMLLEIRLQSEPMPTDLSTHDLVLGLKVMTDSSSVTVAEKFLAAIYESKTGLKDQPRGILVSTVTALVSLHRQWRKTRPNSRRQQAKAYAAEKSEAATSLQQLRVMRDVLLKEALHHLCPLVPSLSSQTVLFLMKELSFAFSLGDHCTYNQDFLDACVLKAIQEDLSISSMAYMDFLLQKMNRMSENLMSNLLRKIENESAEHLDLQEFYPFPILNAMPSCIEASTWSQERLHGVVDKLISHHSTVAGKDSKYIPFTRAGANLACLNYFKPEVIANILKQMTTNLLTILEQYPDTLSVAPVLKGLEKVEFLQFLQFWQALQLLDNSNPLPEVNSRIISVCHEIVKHNAASVASEEKSMTKALLVDALQNNRAALVSGLYTPHYVPVDHALVVQGEGNLIAQSQQFGPTCTSELHTPMNSKILGIIEVDGGSLFNGGLKARSRHLLAKRLLAAEDITVVPLLTPQLNMKQTHKEKYQYITAALHQHGVFV